MNRIRSLREDRDLRQIDVSRATGIDQKTLSNYETGKTNPDSNSIIKLAEFFSVTCDYLLGCSEVSLKNNNEILKQITRIENELAEIKRLLTQK